MAGMQTAVVHRPGNAVLTEAEQREFPTMTDFAQLLVCSNQPKSKVVKANQ